MTRRFDTIVIVDWSARGTPSPAGPSADAIWIAEAGQGRVAVAYWRTRAAAMAWLADRLAAGLARGERLLAGFDFPFGFPRGFAVQVTGRPCALRLWAHLAATLHDGPMNANDRFAVAAALNARFPGIGPFWGRPAGFDLAGLPERGSARAGHGLPERRLVEERVRSAQPCWKLYTTGSVGGQILTGLPMLHRLRTDPRLARHLAVWPFDTGLAPGDAPVVLAEIYPSLLAAEIAAATPPGGIRDEAQVRVTAAAYAALDAAGGLAPLFAAGPDLTAAERRIVAREEAWILGAGHEAALRGALACEAAA